MKVKVYSNEHSAWWREDYWGYTENEEEAGIYDYDTFIKRYPDITFNEENEDYLVGVDPLAVVLECIDLLGRDGINSKMIARHKLLDIVPVLEGMSYDKLS